MAFKYNTPLLVAAHTLRGFWESAAGLLGVPRVYGGDFFGSPTIGFQTGDPQTIDGFLSAIPTGEWDAVQQARMGVAGDQLAQVLTPPNNCTPPNSFVDEPEATAGLMLAGRNTAESAESQAVLGADRVRFLTNDVDLTIDDGRLSRVGDEGWTIATLNGGSGWTNLGGGWPSARYRKDPDGYVTIVGGVTTGTLGTSIFTLPPGYRPTIGLIPIIAEGNTLHARLTVSTTGTVTLHVGSPTAVIFNGRFPTF